MERIPPVLMTINRLDKMLVDNVGDVTITNDGATILSLLEVTHPAVRILHDYKLSLMGSRPGYWSPWPRSRTKRLETVQLRSYFLLPSYYEEQTI